MLNRTVAAMTESSRNLRSWLAWPARHSVLSSFAGARSPGIPGAGQECRDDGGSVCDRDRPDRSAQQLRTVSGVPEDAADDGLFGPASVAWRVSTDLASPVAGLRSLLMQALPSAGDGWCRSAQRLAPDPVGRLAVTSAYLATITFGERAVALHAAARVRRIHDHVRGNRAVTGRPYAAGDPALLLWVSRGTGPVQPGGRLGVRDTAVG